MENHVNLYVYRISDSEYGAGLGRAGCEKLGVIVESWPVSTPAQAKFLASHGTSYHGASEKVSRLANLLVDLMTADPTYGEAEPPKPVIKHEPIAQIEKQDFFQRILSWCYARLLMARSVARRR
jgi:hypothetical protein